MSNKKLDIEKAMNEINDAMNDLIDVEMSLNNAHDSLKSLHNSNPPSDDSDEIEVAKDFKPKNLAEREKILILSELKELSISYLESIKKKYINNENE